MTTEEGSGIGAAARELLIDRHLPRFEARTFSALLVDAGTERTYQAIRALDPDQVWQTVPFMQMMIRLRDLPAGRFRRYWAVIGPFAGYIMRHWLTLAKQHAEQGQ